MTKANLVEIIVVLDRSGSMSTVRNDTIGGFNTFVNDQKSQAKGEVKLTLVQFDDQYEVNYNGRSIQEVPSLTEATYIPRGMTALLDAVGKTINTVGDRLAKTPEAERPSLVIFVTLTDGQENSSKEFKLDQIKSLIEHQTTKYNWQFVFLGADQNAFQAASMGFTASNTYNYSNAKTADTFTYLSRGISNVMAEPDCMMACSAAGNIGEMMRDMSGTSAGTSSDPTAPVMDAIAALAQTVSTSAKMMASLKNAQVKVKDSTNEPTN